MSTRFNWGANRLAIAVPYTYRLANFSKDNQMITLKIIGLLLGFCALSPAAAQEQFKAADGAYSLTVPLGWRLDVSDTSLEISNDEVRISLLSFPAESADAATATAFERLNINPGTLVSAVDAPLPNGTWKQHIYAEGTRLTIAITQLRASKAYVMIIVGEGTDVQAANPQLLQLLTSIAFAETPTPTYVDAGAFEEGAVSFGAEPFILSGALSMPVGAGPFPALVIVHGSGPQNRDGLLGPLTIYRDLAQGLASRGIAVLRYDKRTLTYGAEITIDETFTIDSESTDDALQAVSFLRQQDGIDSARIFVLGHSQGAMVTPRILARDDAIAGGILLAAPARPFSALLNEQLAYIAEVNPSALESPTVKYLQDLADRYNQVAAGASYEDAFGQFATYTQSIERLDAVAEARDISAPLLIMQGERDYQVTMADFARWHDELGADERMTFRSYPELNHLFMASGDLSRLSIPQDYELPAFVDARVIIDIADWIKAHI